MTWCCRCLNIELISEETLDICLKEDEPLNINLDIGTVVVGKDYPEYEGPYIAVPKVTDQIFETKKRSMEENFVVTKITHLETPNAGGGLTVTIGEI